MTRAEYECSPKLCERCNDPIPFEKRINKFCGHSCAATVANTQRAPRSEESRRKTGDSLLGRIYEARETRYCRSCQTEFEATTRARRYYCSPECGNRLKADRLRKLQAEQSLMHVKSELAPLAALNKLFNTSFHKERVCGHYFDFVDSQYLIEYTSGYGKEITSATIRFKAAVSDPRTKILYANTVYLGYVRLARLVELNVTVRDYEELQEGS